MQIEPDIHADDTAICCRAINQRPVVIIEQNQEDLGQLIGLYLGLADIILVPNAYVGVRMINLFRSEDVEILAIEGLLGYASSRQEGNIARIWSD
ncbi:hypothetical protein ACTU44_05020 [Thalassospira sp. SM2505]|uniref:Uncharacterized protein n=1 Tax=Thalassospira profundimaris TaxID=502049 RepID=A0A367WXI1_9PROT|nr:hypothetical protein [Thalassospira profundimaris]RCK46155.1 hypothetical protein TH30_10045 [Thalassospira profundimaris]